ncbi:MAG: tRNA-dihydrouridine synthase [Clostridiales bacterium]|nr:tRNA-dihydrouridine synthase [Clostridiales bacterium]
MPNGNIDSAPKAKQVMDITGCDFVMIGRATLGNPWLFAQINSYLKNPEEPLYFPALEEKLDVMLEHINAMVTYKGEHTALLQARKLVTGYFKGIRGAAELRNEAGRISTTEDLYALRQKALSMG